MKRLLSIALALVMVLSIAVSPKAAYAEPDEGYSVSAAVDVNYLLPGDSADLVVNASPSDDAYSFSWSFLPEQGGAEVALEGETGSQLHLDDPMPGQYTCFCQSMVLSKYVYFQVNVDNDLSVYAVDQEGEAYYNSARFYISSGSSQKLEVVVEAEDARDLRYQWYSWDKDYEHPNTDGSVPFTRVIIDGATESSYTVTNFSDLEKEFECIVTDRYGHFDSGYFDLRRDIHFSATAKNFDYYVDVEPGKPAVLEVEASVDEPYALKYQWYLEDSDTWDRTPIEGATSVSYTTEPLTSIDNDYCCQVWAEYEGRMLDETWVNFSLYFNNKLQLRPVGDDHITVKLGESATLAVKESHASGDVRLQWYKLSERDFDDAEKTLIEGAAGETLTLTDVQQGGFYTCYAEDDYGSNYYITFTVAVDNAFTLKAVGNTRPTVSIGDTVEFEVVASARQGNIQYQWFGPKWVEYGDGYGYYDHVAIDGETSTKITVQITCDDSYFCRAVDEFGNERTAYFYPELDRDAIAGADAYVIYVDKGQPAVLALTGSVADPENVHFTWRNSADEVIGTGSSYTVSSVDGYAEYECGIEYKGFHFSRSFEVRVDSGFLPTIDSTLIKAEVGSDVTLAVNSGYTGVVDYTWQDDDSFETLSKEASYTIRNASPGDSGWYYCRATDEYGNRYSYSINLVVGEEEELTAKSSRTAEVNIGGSAVFEVYPLSDPGVTYQWSGPDGILEGETGTKLVINNAQKGGNYHCTANDSEGYSFQSVNFTLRISNGFHCDHDGSTLIYVKKGAPVTLTVSAGSDSGVEYTWHAYSEGLDLSDEKGPSVTVPSVNEPVFAVCLVEDKFGNSGYAAFEVDIDTGIYINDIKDVYIRSGERAQITVDAGASEGNCRVSMMVEEGSSLPIAAQNGNTFTTVRLTNDVKVRAIATDDYRGQVDTTFTIHVLPEGGLMKGDVNGDNEISADDLTLLSRYVAGIEPIPGDAVKAACDVTGDGEVTADDLTKLSRKVAGIIQTLD